MYNGQAISSGSASCGQKQLRRRALLAAGASLLAAASLPLPARSSTLSTTTPEELQRFMTVSLRLTDRDTLQPLMGRALFDTLLEVNATRRREIGQLYDLLQAGHFASASEFAHAAEQSDPAFKETIHDLMHGWYRGVVGQTVVVYRAAIMFALTQDAVFPKTYATAKPFYWTERPPVVGQPQGQPALSPSQYVAESQ
ncbi:sugar dehydrogenase complex small subunit [Gluconacetobacter sp. Hr-1-5]|uniref:sugar dehydrogenase complex small subunit n=1 Tax=Gluconacetobacter sp. Hr-1-5 TaxID=3395370 RepID=UPI003B515FA1